MKKVMVKGLALAFAGAVLIAGDAMALPILTLSDGTNSVTVNDNGAGDLFAGIDGVISYAGTIGGWDITMSMGSSYPSIGSVGHPELHLTSSLTTFSAGTLTFSFEDTFTGWDDLGGFVTSIGGRASGDVSLKTFLDGTEIASLGVFSGAFSDSLVSYVSPADANSYNLKLVGIITHDAGGMASSFDAAVAPVPEPATMLLFGSGLAGLAGYGRRKVRKK